MTLKKDILQALKSRTVLFGLLITLASMIQVFLPYLPAEYVGPVGAGVGAAVILLRFLTTVPIAEK